jgi:hypothetical protein
MQTYEYREGALDCLKANRAKLGITVVMTSKILLHAGHELSEWETEWLTYRDKWVYFALTCIDFDQKTKLWTLVEELTRMYASGRRPGPQDAHLAG